MSQITKDLSLSVPISRKTFFKGILALGLIWFFLNLFVGKNNFMLTIISLTLAPYVASLWYAKRITDIWPDKKAKIVMAILLAGFLILNLAGLAVRTMTNNAAEAVISGADFNATALQIAGAAYSILAAIFSIFTLVLLFKRGKSKNEPQVL